MVKYTEPRSRTIRQIVRLRKRKIDGGMKGADFQTDRTHSAKCIISSRVRWTRAFFFLDLSKKDVANKKIGRDSPFHELIDSPISCHTWHHDQALLMKIRMRKSLLQANFCMVDMEKVLFQGEAFSVAATSSLTESDGMTNVNFRGVIQRLDLEPSPKNPLGTVEADLWRQNLSCTCPKMQREQNLVWNSNLSRDCFPSLAGSSHPIAFGWKIKRSFFPSDWPHLSSRGA